MVPPVRVDTGLGCSSCISDDHKAAAAVNRKNRSGYMMLPNGRNYYKEAGYVEEMEAVEKALANREREKIPSLLPDRWLAARGVQALRDILLLSSRQRDHG